MPREIVYDRFTPYGEEENARIVLEIRWGRDQDYVQLATRCVLATATDFAFVHPDLEDILAKLSKDDAEKIRVMLSGVYSNLDRSGLNRTIRFLRRARDQAFGRDE